MLNRLMRRHQNLPHLCGLARLALVKLKLPEALKPALDASSYSIHRPRRGSQGRGQRTHQRKRFAEMGTCLVCLVSGLHCCCCWLRQRSAMGWMAGRFPYAHATHVAQPASWSPWRREGMLGPSRYPWAGNFTTSPLRPLNRQISIRPISLSHSCRARETSFPFLSRLYRRHCVEHSVYIKGRLSASFNSPMARSWI
jgi:hypothetical protein